MENIRPSADLRNKYNEMSEFCRETRSPIFITVHGRGDTVLMNVEDYRQKMAELELLQLLAESEADVKEGRVYSEKAFDDLEKELFGENHALQD